MQFVGNMSVQAIQCCLKCCLFTEASAQVSTSSPIASSVPAGDETIKKEDSFDWTVGLHGALHAALQNADACIMKKLH